MDVNILGNLLMTYIEVSYKGGVQQFTEDGGLISVVPFAENAALIYLKNPPEYFVEAIEEFNKRNNCQVKIATDLNFENESKTDVLLALSEVFKDLAEKFSLTQIMVNPSNSLVLYINIPDVDLSEEEITEITSILVSRLRSLVRGVLIVKDESYPFDQVGVSKAIPNAEYTPETVTHEQAITEDHITDLKIALANAETIDDILNMM